MAKPAPLSPLAPKGGFPTLPPIKGARFATVSAGVRYAGRTDVMMAALDPGTTAAGVFTRSSTRSAPVLWCEQALRAADPADGFGVLVNSGNANAFTGSAGRVGVEKTAGAAGEVLGVPAGNVFVASTGVIGEPLPWERITAKMAELGEALSADGAEAAARAIMTTDTFPKGASAEIVLGDHTVRIAGFAKGSGMIAPDMATMLAYVFTDAAVAQPVLQAALSELNEITFNAITVDSDTSTSDTLMLFATGQSGAKRIDSTEDPDFAAFRIALHSVLQDLAHQVVRDGEGATKFVAVTVEGAASDSSARVIARGIANSPLVKTAIAGEDPNWGRIVMAVGKSGEPADRDKLSIRFGDIVVAEAGWVSPSYREEDGAAYMKQEELAVHVNVGVGSGQATVWTCDLTHGYITINADYRS